MITYHAFFVDEWPPTDEQRRNASRVPFEATSDSVSWNEARKIACTQGKEVSGVVRAKQLPAIGCYLGWSGCTNTADVVVGNGYVCANCATKMSGRA